MAFDPSKCLKFTALEDGCVISVQTSQVDGSHYQFSKDGSNWIEDTITINNGESAYCKGTNYPCNNSNRAWVFKISKKVTIDGNVMSLVDDGAGALTEITQEWGFYALFDMCPEIMSINKDLLPATTLTRGCYAWMFGDNNGLTSIPEGLLPATTLTIECYAIMFANCENLKTIPKNLLPAEELAPYCYQGMFEGCSNLASLPTLPAKKLEARCYCYMFFNCFSLLSIPDGYLPATDLPEGCYECMFCGCEGLIKVSRDALADFSSEQFESCSQMFFACPKLKEIAVHWTSWPSSEDATNGWVGYVAENGIFYCPTELPRIFDEDHIPEGWTVLPLPEPKKTFTANFFKKYKIGGRAK